MPILKKLKVVDERVHFINDVDCTYNDPDRPAVKIIQPINVVFGKYIEEDLADAEMLAKSLNNGVLKSFIEKGLVKVVYFNEETEVEVSEEEYKNFLKTETTKISEVTKLAKLLEEKGLTAEKLAAIIEKASKEENKVDVSPIITQGVKKEGVLLEDTKVNVPVEIIEPKNYEEYSKIPYQKRLRSIHNIKDTELLKEILAKDKSTLSIKTIVKRFKDLGVSI